MSDSDETTFAQTDSQIQAQQRADAIAEESGQKGGAIRSSDGTTDNNESKASTLDAMDTSGNNPG